MSVDSRFAIDRLGVAARPQQHGDADASAKAEREAIARAALEFESLFLLQMLKQMRQSMLSDGGDEPGLGSSTMFDTIDAHLAQYLAGNRGGLTPMLVTALGGASAAEPAVATPSVPETEMKAQPTPAPASVATTVPLPGDRVSSAYGWRADPFSGAAKFHAGIDIRAAYGTDVPAAGAGKVVFAGEQGGYGNTVVIEHGAGRRTRYAHLSLMAVQEGDPVIEGQIIGRVGQTGRATGPHLHFEVIEGGRRVDPLVASFRPSGLLTRSGGFAPPDPPAPSLAGTPSPRSAPAGAPVARLVRYADESQRVRDPRGAPHNGLKVAGGVADYPSGSAQPAAQTGDEHEN